MTTGERLEDLLDVVRDLTRAVQVLCDAQKAKNKVLDEIHEACCGDKPKSDLEPWMKKIAEACADTADGVRQLVDGVEQIPGRVAELLDVGATEE